MITAAFVSSWLWAIFTIIAAFAQTVRNAMQRELAGTLGTAGATHVRFLFGFPFALVFLVGLMMVTGAPRPGRDSHSGRGPSTAPCFRSAPRR